MDLESKSDDHDNESDDHDMDLESSLHLLPPPKGLLLVLLGSLTYPKP